METLTKEFKFIPLKTDTSKSEGFDAFAEYNQEQKNKAEFTQEDLDASEKRGYEKGLAEGEQIGIEKGKGERMALDQQLNASFAVIAQQVEGFTNVLYNALLQKERDTVKLASVIAKKIAGDAVKEDPTARIEPLVKQAMEVLFAERAIDIVVNEELIEALQQKIEAIAEETGFSGQLKIRGSKHLPPGGCKVEWESGAATYDVSTIWTEINKLLGIDDDSTSNNVTVDVAQASVSDLPPQEEVADKPETKSSEEIEETETETENKADNQEQNNSAEEETKT